jgi:hypothetical protein
LPVAIGELLKCAVEKRQNIKINKPLTSAATKALYAAAAYVLGIDKKAFLPSPGIGAG